jgi:hypothetical protein
VSEIRRFFWGKSQQKYYLSYVSWDCICLLTEKEGLGLRSLDILNKAIIVKAFWTLATNQQSMWGGHMCSKIQRSAYLVDCGTLPANSTIFNILLQARNNITHKINGKLVLGKA